MFFKWVKVTDLRCFQFHGLFNIFRFGIDRDVLEFNRLAVFHLDDQRIFLEIPRLCTS